MRPWVRDRDIWFSVQDETLPQFHETETLDFLSETTLRPS